MLLSSSTRGSASASGRSSRSNGRSRPSSSSTTATASATDRRHTSGTPLRSSSLDASGAANRLNASFTPHCVRIPCARFFADVRSRTRCIRRRSRSFSARSSSEGTHSSGTRSRRASSASTRASMMSVFTASEATALALRASAICTRQPAEVSRSRTHAAPLIISTHALTSQPSAATSRARPSSSAGIQSRLLLDSHFRGNSSAMILRAPPRAPVRPVNPDILHSGPPFG